MEELEVLVESERALGESVWGRKVATLPDEGVLLVCTDLQGNYEDYLAMKALYLAEERAGNRPVLAFCGDLVHGPSPGFVASGRWPPGLGRPYEDRSAEILRDLARFSSEARVFSLLGNHEHAHVGGPKVARFHPDEAAALEAVLGTETDLFRAFLASFPLLAVGRCGVVLTHGAPAGTEPELGRFEQLRYQGYSHVPLFRMADQGTLGRLLWARCARPEQAEALLRVATLDGEPSAFVVYGHDVVPEGYEITGRNQICVSTSYGVEPQRKVYLRLDLGHRYRSVEELREGHEIRWLYRSEA